MEKIPSLDFLEQQISEQKKKHLVSQPDVVEETARRKIDMPLRRLRYNASHGIFKKPVRIGREVFYEADYIYPAITCNYLLKIQFGLSLRKIKKIMSANGSSMKTLLDRIQIFLGKYGTEDKRPGYYYLIEQKFVEALAGPSSAVDLDKIEKEAKDGYDKSGKGK